MMAATRDTIDLIDRLPDVRGTVEANADISRFTWFRTGGPAEVLFRPADVDDLCAMMAALPADVPVMVIGVGSNLLVRDGGVSGVVVRLGKTFSDINVNGQQVSAGAAATDVAVAGKARDAGIGGLAFLSGIPGTIGGAVRMNAGAYGAEMIDCLVSAEVVRRDGGLATLTRDELGFSYRHSDLAADDIVVSVLLQGAESEPAVVRAQMDEIRESREESQPLRTRTVGSTFRNPAGHKAWQLIDAAGCRGLRRGGAMVSEKHCNFLINTEDASAADIEGLGEEVRRRVKEQSGVTLEWEIRRIGLTERGLEDVGQ